MTIFTELPTHTDVLPSLCKVITAARRIPSGNPSAWKPAVQSRWNIALAKLAELLRTALANPTEINLFNAVYNLISAPGSVLGPLFGDVHRKESVHDVADQVVSSALRKVLKGQERKAMKQLCSNGVATVTPAAVDALNQRDHDLKLPSTDLPQLQVFPHDIADSLFLSCGDLSIAKDVYGWAPWLFLSCRGAQDGFFRAFVLFACFLANKPGNFPTVCSALLSAGALTPLNKVTEVERKQLEDAGRPPNYAQSIQVPYSPRPFSRF